MAAGIQSLDRSLRDSARFRLTRRVGPVLVLLILVHPGTLAEVWPHAAAYSLVLGNFLWLPLTIGLGILALCVFIEVLVESSRSDRVGANCCITVDDSGLRLSRPGCDRYVPFEDMACCLLIDGGDDLQTSRRRHAAGLRLAWEARARMTVLYPDSPILAALDDRGRVVGWAPVSRWLAGADRLERIMRSVDVHLHRRRDETPGWQPALARHGSALKPWLERASRLCGEGAARHPYRTGIPTQRELLALAGDANAALELRAVAVHTLFSGDLANEMPDSLLGADTPPLVVAAAYLAGRDDRRTRGLLSRAMSFLSEEDRACVDTAGKERRWSRAA